MKRYWLLVIMMSSIALSACNQMSVREDSGLVQGKTLDQSNPRAKLVLGSDELVGKVNLASPKFRPIGALTQAQVSVQNLTETRYSLEYKFDWEDAHGFKEGDSGSWHRFTLTPRQVVSFASTGKVPEATNIVFTVRLPDDYFISQPKQEKDQ